MGGLMILSGLVVTLLWANLNNPYIWIVLFVTLGFGRSASTTIISRSRNSRTRASPAACDRC